MQLTETLLIVGSTFFITDGLQTIAAGALRGMNDTRVPLLFAVISYWLIGFATACWLGFWTTLGPVGVCGHGGDAVHHGVGEAHLALDPGGQVGVPEPGEGGERAAGQVAVVLQVVAGHDGERGQAALPATA